MTSKLNPEIVKQAIANLKAQGYGAHSLSAQSVEMEYYRILNTQKMDTMRGDASSSTAGRGGWFGKRGQ